MRHSHDELADSENELIEVSHKEDKIDKFIEMVYQQGWVKREQVEALLAEQKQRVIDDCIAKMKATDARVYATDDYWEFKKQFLDKLAEMK